MNQGLYTSALADTLGETGATPAAWKSLQKNFDSNGEAQLVMYSTKTCGYCKRARKHFESAGLDYVEYFIDRDERAKRDYETLYGRGTPLIFNGYRRQSGFNPRTISNIL